MGQAEILVPTGVQKEALVEPQESLQIPQVNCTFLCGYQACAPLLL